MAGSGVGRGDLRSPARLPVKRYIALFEAQFLVVTLPPWSDNLDKRLAKTAKIYFNDAGLLAHLPGVDADGLAHQSVSKGALVENFAVVELMKLAANSQARPSPKFRSLPSNFRGNIPPCCQTDGRAPGHAQHAQRPCGSAPGPPDRPSRRRRRVPHGRADSCRAAHKTPRYVRASVVTTKGRVRPCSYRTARTTMPGAWTADHARSAV